MERSSFAAMHGLNFPIDGFVFGMQANEKADPKGPAL